eukprot:5281165-Pleurochrysis_carterae.AAC.1
MDRGPRQAWKREGYEARVSHQGVPTYEVKSLNSRRGQGRCRRGQQSNHGCVRPTRARVRQPCVVAGRLIAAHATKGLRRRTRRCGTRCDMAEKAWARCTSGRERPRRRRGTRRSPQESKSTPWRQTGRPQRGRQRSAAKHPGLRRKVREGERHHGAFPPATSAAEFAGALRR